MVLFNIKLINNKYILFIENSDTNVIKKIELDNKYRELIKEELNKIYELKEEFNFISRELDKLHPYTDNYKSIVKKLESMPNFNDPEEKSEYIEINILPKIFSKEEINSFKEEK